MRTYTSKSQAPINFTLDGVEFTATGSLSILEVLELAKHFDADVESAEGLAAVADFFRGLLGGDYDRFRAHCREHRTDPDTLIGIMQDVMDDLSGRPFDGSSRSPGGPSTTGPTLKVVSPSQSQRVAAIQRLGGEVSRAS